MYLISSVGVPVEINSLYTPKLCLIKSITPDTKGASITLALTNSENASASSYISFSFKVIFKNQKYGIYNIGNDEGEISVLGLVAITEEVMKLKINYKITSYPKEYPPDEPQRRCPDISNAKKNLNYFPKISLREGLKRHFTWSKNFLQN